MPAGRVIMAGRSHSPLVMSTEVPATLRPFLTCRAVRMPAGGNLGYARIGEAAARMAFTEGGTLPSGAIEGE